MRFDARKVFGTIPEGNEEKPNLYTDAAGAVSYTHYDDNYKECNISIKVTSDDRIEFTADYLHEPYSCFTTTMDVKKLRRISGIPQDESILDYVEWLSDCIYRHITEEIFSKTGGNPCFFNLAGHADNNGNKFYLPLAEEDAQTILDEANFDEARILSTEAYEKLLREGNVAQLKAYFTELHINSAYIILKDEEYDVYFIQHIYVPALELTIDLNNAEKKLSAVMKNLNETLFRPIAEGTLNSALEEVNVRLSDIEKQALRDRSGGLYTLIANYFRNYWLKGDEEWCDDYVRSDIMTQCLDGLLPNNREARDALEGAIDSQIRQSILPNLSSPTGEMAALRDLHRELKYITLVKKNILDPQEEEPYYKLFYLYDNNIRLRNGCFTLIRTLQDAGVVIDQEEEFLQFIAQCLDNVTHMLVSLEEELLKVDDDFANLIIEKYGAEGSRQAIKGIAKQDLLPLYWEIKRVQEELSDFSLEQDYPPLTKEQWKQPTADLDYRWRERTKVLQKYVSFDDSLLPIDIPFDDLRPLKDDNTTKRFDLSRLMQQKTIGIFVLCTVAVVVAGAACLYFYNNAAAVNLETITLETITSSLLEGAAPTMRDL